MKKKIMERTVKEDGGVVTPGNGKKVMAAAYLTVFAMVFVSALYFAFFSSDVQFSPPSESGMSYEDAHGIVSKLGDDGIDWYCGKIERYTDSQGNEYGVIELTELKKIVGNEERLREELCL